MNQQPPVRLTYRLLSYLMSALLAGQPLLPALSAALTPTGNTSTDNAANGVPLVNIATPNGAGISHNQFKDYNVGKEGLILNNATDKLNQTQLGGIITGNPNLMAGKEAKGIINEVTGGNRSQLQGYTEVVGKAANVMVANPYGITCNGCGFINTPQATLTTGKPVFDANGNLQALDVKKGSITIEGKGIDTSGSNALSIISRATEVNAAIHAKNLQIIVGTNRVGADGSVRAQQGEGNGPSVAVDTGALGGMYANRIYLVSSDKGVGVNLGDLNARQGDITLDVNGKLAVHNSLASGAINAKGQSIAMSGDHKASGNITLDSQSDIALSNGSLNSDNDLALNANGTLSHRASKLTAGRDVKLAAKNIRQDAASQINAARHISTKAADTLSNKGQMTAGQNLTVSAATLTQDGKLLAKGNARLNTSTLINSGAVQSGALTIDSTTLSNSGSLLSDGDMQLQGDKLSTAAGAQVQSGKNLSIKAREASLAGTQAAQQALTVNASETLTHSGKSSAATLSLNAPQMNNSGVLVAASLSAQSQTLTNSGLLQGENVLTLSTSALDNQLNGTLYSAENLQLDIPDISNSGLITSDKSLTLNAAKLGNSGKVIANALTVKTTTLAGDGLLQGTNALAIAGDALAQGTAGRWLTAGDLSLSGQTLTTAGATQGQNLSINATDWNHSGSALATGNLNATLTNSLLNAGDLMSQGDFALAAPTLSNHGNLLSSGDLTLTGITFSSNGALQGNTLSLTGESIANQGAITGLNGLTLNSAGALNNSGDLLTQKALTLTAGDVSNSGRLQGQNIVLDGGSLTNSGAIQSALDLALALSGDLIAATGSTITALGDARLMGKALSNQGLISAKTLDVKGDSLSNGGEISGVDGLNLTLNGGLHQQGKMLTAGVLNIKAKDISNRGQLQGADIQVSASSLSNAGRVQGDSGLTIALLDALTNQASGILLSQNALSLTAPVLTNDGTIQGNGRATLSAATQARNDGKILSAGDLTLTTPDYSGSGWLQATNLVLNVAKLASAGNVDIRFTSNISNTNTTANAGKISNTIVAPGLNTPSAQNIGDGVSQQSLDEASSLAITTLDWQNAGGNQSISSGMALAPGGIDGNYPLPSGNNGYFVPSTDPDSPYLITVNPNLDGLGQLDPSLFGDLYKLLGMSPDAAPKETNSQYTNASQFLGSSYMLDRLNLNPDKDYRFLGDAAFDTRYVSNYVLNQTGTRYINGLGSDLDQMRYLMDSAADAQTSLGLTFGVALSADQVAALDHSILWWESATINGQTVMVPKVYLSPKDVTVQSGSVISGNNVQLAGGNVTNSGSSLVAQNGLSIDSSNSINNLNAGLIRAGGGLELSALGDINNISSAISGKTVQLESTGGNINNITHTVQWDAGDDSIHLSGIDTGQTAAIIATDSLIMGAANDINITGANVAAGGDLVMGAGNNINIAANQITGSSSQSGLRGQNSISASSTANQGSNITAGGNALMQADNDLNVTASAIGAGKTAQLAAGNDLNLNAASNGQTSRTGDSESHQRSADRTTISAGDNVTLVAGRDVTSQAAGIAAEGNVGIQAGRDVNLLAEATVNGSSTREKKKTVIDESVRQQGSEIASGGNTTIIAGRDVNAEAAQVTASGNIGVAAGRDVNLTTATESDYHYKEETKTKKGFLNKKTTHTIEEDSATREAGTLLSGDNVTVQAGNNLLVKGSSVVGDNTVALGAGNNVDIVAATNTDSSWRFKEEKKSGLMGSGGIGFTIGSSKTTHDLREAGTTQSQSFSTIGSTGGSVAISAGNQAHIGGADLIARKDLSLSGSSVLIDPGHDKRTRDETFEQKKSGLTIALSGAVGGAINNAVASAQDAKEESDGRLAALQTTKSVLSGVQAWQAIAVDAANSGNPDNPSNNAIGISASLTTQKSKSEQHAQSDAVTGSTLNAGNNLSITANGKKGDGNIVIAGSQLKAGGDTLLDAKNDILLAGAANTQQTTGKNSSSGGGIGIGIGVGSDGWGINVFASGNSARGKDQGNGADWTETTLDSGKTVTLKSGNDTLLDGALVNGNKIVADVGHDLLMRSQQDNNDYDSKQTSVAGGGSFSFGSMSGSAYVSLSQDKMKSRFDSVAEQTGLYAGDGGFDITVGNHTQLDGAVIASTATADKNRLDTGGVVQRGLQAVTGALTALAGGGNLAGALAGASAPELAHIIGHRSGLSDQEALIAHAVLGGVVASLQGNSAAAGAVGAVTGELAATAIKDQLFPGKNNSDLSESDKQLISNLATLASGLAGNLTSGNSADTAAAAQAGKNAVENNALSFPSGMMNYGQAVASWNQYAQDNNLTPEQTQTGLDKLAKGDMPDGTNITKVIVDGSSDMAFAFAAWELGLAATAGKAVGGGLLGLAANSGYQVYDLNQAPNTNKSWDYLGSATSFTTGMLAPGRGVLPNTGIAMGGAFFTDGPNSASLVGAGIGAGLGGAFGKYGPFSGEVNDIFGSFGGEFISNEVKNAGAKNDD